MSRLFGHDVFTVGAGRTDAGVHALGQVMSTTDVPDDADLDKARDALNAMCGPSIAVSTFIRVSDHFHARFSARSRTYVYAIMDGAIPDPFLAATTLHHSTSLDTEAMTEAAGHLLGVRDFTSFGRPSEPEGSAERTLFELACRRVGRIVRIRARADAFIQQMVRSLVGTLIQVGEGRRSPDEIPAVLSARDRSAAGPVAPPHGLCLVSVEYDEGSSSPDPVI